MKVSNPLTIIAIFAGVAEAFATGALVALPEQLQDEFIIFVMAFPSAIVAIFFLILWNRPVVLYAPSDYEDQDHFLEANKLKEVIQKEAQKTLDNLSKEKHGSIEVDWERVSAEIAVATIDTLASSSEKVVYDYLKDHPKEAFTPRGLKFILPVSKADATFALYSLESKGLVQKGVDGDVVVWQVKI